LRERIRNRIDERISDPVFWNDVIQVAKTVLAAVVGWVVAAEVLELEQAFLAPWSALLVVHSTVYRTFSKGAQQVAATVVAVLLASAVGELLGLSTVSMTLLLVVAFTLGPVPWLGEEATTVATTGVVVLTTGFHDDTMLVDRLLATAIGVVVGLMVNAIVWPPLRRRAAAEALDRVDDRLGELLVDMAGGLGAGCQQADVDDWIDRTRDIDADLDQAWALVRQAQESARMNPRKPARRMRNPERWHVLLRHMEQTVAETRSLARTLGGQEAHKDTWGESFAVPWISALGDAGRAAASDDPEALRDVRRRLQALSEDMRSTERSAEWAIYGALIINLRNIVDAMDAVALAGVITRTPLPVSPPLD
jgi:uncharacterized membrane protein YccC